MKVKNIEDLKFWHMEIVCHNPDAAVKFMQETLEAEICEQDNARVVTDHWDSECQHVQAAGTVFQFLTPGLLPEQSWKKTLDTQGPCIHNVCFSLAKESCEAVKDAMLARGAKLIEKISPPGGKFIVNGQEIDAGYCGYWIDATEQCGMRFELSVFDSSAFDSSAT